MFVNRKNKSIFIHNPKAAGTSIRNSFPLEEYGVLSRHRMFPHNPASVVKRNVGEKCWDEYFKYGFVRNPYDRCVSYYFFHRSDQYRFPPGKEEAYKPFDVWIQERFGQHLLIKRNDTKEFGKGGFVQIKQSEYLDIDVDFIGRYENLQDDFDYVCGQLNIDSHKLPHYNKSKEHNHWESYYTDELKEIVYEFFKEDFERFEYSI